MLITFLPLKKEWRSEHPHTIRSCEKQNSLSNLSHFSNHDLNKGKYSCFDARD